MVNTNQNLNNDSANNHAAGAEVDVDVLYQKLGDRWFAFSIINDDVFMAPISDDQITEMKTVNASTNLKVYDL